MIFIIKLLEKEENIRMADIKVINGKYFVFDPHINESFVITAKELKNLGIKNYYFMLEIKNPRVADIDPFKKNITEAEVKLLLAEYRANMWWFMRTAVRLRTQSGIVQFTLHRGICAACYNFLKHQDFCLCEPRQTYKTTELIAGPIQWVFQLYKNNIMHFFGKESDNTKKNLASLKDDISLLPEWMRFTRYMDTGGKIKKAHQATERLQNNLMTNDLLIHPSAKSLSSAQSLGRGGSGNVIYYDEIEHTLYFGEILSNSAPLFKTASENAAKVGGPYCRILTCTPNCRIMT